MQTDVPDTRGDSTLNAAIESASAVMCENSREVVTSVAGMRRASTESAASSQFCATASVEQLSSMEEVFSSADDLSRLAETLQQAIGRFRM